jgi:nitroimidazol reductase NimA-like FMN-containing flavoprotein (pyridoxamine 5'-phosphate oxidase superfamily)
MRGVATSPDERWFPSHLREIDKAECLELLAGHTVGRVAYCDALGPVVLPVNYVLDQETVLIQISPHSTLAASLRSARASFEIDDFDAFNQSGWSVLVRGDAAYAEPADLPDHDDRPVTWAEGQRTLHVRITPHDISGRRLLSA